MQHDLSVIYTRPDGSFVIDRGLYHVPMAGEFWELWDEVFEYSLLHPEVVREEPSPDPVEETDEPVVSVEDRLSALEDGLVEIAEILFGDE